MKNLFLSLWFPLYALAQYDATPWQLRIYTNVDDMVAHANPNAGNKIVYVQGYYSWNDGGAGFYAVTNTVSSTNRSRFKCAVGDGTKSFEMIPDSSGIVNIRRFGGKCDGVSSDTAALMEAIAYCKRKGGGKIYIPGQSLWHLDGNVDKSNIELIGDVSIKDYRTPITTPYWGPDDPSKDMIQVGDDTGIVKGFRIRDATLFGNGHGRAGLYFGPGSVENRAEGVTIWGFKTNFMQRGGNNYPCTKNVLIDFELENGNVANSRSVYLYNPGGVGYMSAASFIGGHIQSHNNSGEYAVEIDGAEPTFTDVYVDVGGNNKGFLIKKTSPSGDSAWLDGVNLHIDSDNSSDILFDCYLDIRDAGWWANGLVYIDGKLKIPSDSSVTPTPGPMRSRFTSSASFFGVTGELALMDNSTVNGYDSRRRFWVDGNLNGENTAGNVNFFANQNVSLKATNGAVILQGLGGGISVPSGNITFTNGVGIYFKDPLGVDVSVLSAPGYNAQLNAEGNVTITPGTNFVVIPGGGAIFDGTLSGSHAITLTAFDLYFDNNRALLGRDTGGTYRNLVVLDSSNNLQLFNGSLGGDTQIGTRYASGMLRFYSGSATERWRIDSSGHLKPILATYDIADGTTRVGTGYFTALNLPGGDVATLIAAKQDADSDLTAIAGLSSTGFIVRTGSGTATTRSMTSGGHGLSVSNGNGVSGDVVVDLVVTNYVPIELTNPNVAVTTPSTNFVVMPEAGTLKTVTVHLLKASSSGSVTIDVKKNGTTVLSAPVSISSGATNATATVSVAGFSALDRIAGEVTAAGTDAYGAMALLGFTNP